MKIAIIGVGYWGNKHVEELNALGITPIICDANKENIKACMEKFKVSHVEDFEQILNDKTIEAVIICLPNELHFEFAKRALESGKHVLVEKPITVKYKDGVHLVDIAEKNGKILSVGHIFRFNNAIREIKNFITNDDFGEIYMAKLSWTNLESPFERDIIFDLATHPFDILYYLFDKFPDEISCVGEGYRVDGKEAIFINSKIGKILVNFELNYLSPERKRELMVIGEKMSVKVDCISQEIDKYLHTNDISYGRTRKSTMNKIVLIKNNALREELKNFIDSINGDAKNTNSGKECAEVVRMLQLSRKSADERRKIVIERD